MGAGGIFANIISVFYIFNFSAILAHCLLDLRLIKIDCNGARKR